MRGGKPKKRGKRTVSVCKVLNGARQEISACKAGPFAYSTGAKETAQDSLREPMDKQDRLAGRVARLHGLERDVGPGLELVADHRFVIAPLT